MAWQVAAVAAVTAAVAAAETSMFTSAVCVVERASSRSPRGVVPDHGWMAWPARRAAPS